MVAGRAAGIRPGGRRCSLACGAAVLPARRSRRMLPEPLTGAGLSARLPSLLTSARAQRLRGPHGGRRRVNGACVADERARSSGPAPRMLGEPGGAGDGLRRRAAGMELKAADVRAELAMHVGNLGVDERGAVWPSPGQRLRSEKTVWERLAARRRFGQTANLLFGTSQTETTWRRGSQSWKLHIRTRLSQQARVSRRLASVSKRHRLQSMPIVKRSAPLREYHPLSEQAHPSTIALRIEL